MASRTPFSSLSQVDADLASLALFRSRGIVEHVGHGSQSQDAWEEVDPDELSRRFELDVGSQNIDLSEKSED
ncbi:hypothetical protein HPP92_022107 [Vanilla planifolia]|uniref:Uncharacterized protein n=1 Tax=Vanilla planifolia TaxID=51239 RepID=A0A835UDH9_VANPL|nr:hypothetical protein HPP92_022405 [Vanilla planifolia]KAG0458979.1 hypothetical protein HPP92_022107 [Vanilla planifolia]